jgi:acyl-CoA dehydrogenase
LSAARFPEIRDAVRALCADFPDAYHRRVDAERGYPVEFVDALTKAGWLAALIPQEFGGAGLGRAWRAALAEHGGHRAVRRHGHHEELDPRGPAR